MITRHRSATDSFETRYSGRFMVGVLLLSLFTTCLPLERAHAEGPGGRSRFLHVECGAFCPGGALDWATRWDDATLAEGYRYSVSGRTYRGGSGDFHCWFFTDKGSVTIECPKKTQGTLHVLMLDGDSGQRKQEVVVEGKNREVVANFPGPRGAWRKYPVSADDTADGKILIEVAKVGGANAVLTRIDFVPDGVKDALLPEVGVFPQTSKGLIEQDWYRQERLQRRQPGSEPAVLAAIERGQALLRAFRQLDVTQAKTQLDQFRVRHGKLAEREQQGENVAELWNELYFETRWTVRELAFRNPLLDFDELLFVKGHTPQFGHQCSHHVGSAQRRGGDLCVLKGLSPDGEVRSLIGEELSSGAIGRPDLSFDARRVVFPYAKPREVPTPYPIGKAGAIGGDCEDYQLFQINVDGSGLEQLTDGLAENTEPCYLPNGRICFTSSRCDRLVQCGDWAIVFSMYTMNPDGSDVKAITEAKEGEWFPSVLEDGRIIYMRWEYVLKAFNNIQYLWTVNPDGTGAKLAYGDHYAFSPGPRSFIEPRQIPGTSKIMTTGAAHHNCGVGPICIVDLDKNRGNLSGLERITPEVRYPETDEVATEKHTAGWYNAPYPLSETFYLACYSFEAAHNAAAGYGIYLLDTHGNKELIFRAPDISCYSPIPLRRRAVPAQLARVRAPRDPASHSGTVLMADVYRGLSDVKRGTIKHLRVVETIPKTAHSNPQRLDMGVGSGWDPRRILGTVPVEKDGSAHFTVPAGKSLFLQALDEDHMNVRGMRSFMNLQANEQVSCVGCHESYGSAPPNLPAVAFAKKPAKISAPPWGAVPVSFPKLVQPVLNQHCVSCHDGSEGKNKSFDLTAKNLVVAKGANNEQAGTTHRAFKVTASFMNLLEHVDYTRLGGYEGKNVPMAAYSVGSHRSSMITMLDAGHYDVKLSKSERRAIVAWIDCNAPYLGGWNDYFVAEHE